MPFEVFPRLPGGPVSGKVQNLPYPLPSTVTPFSVSRAEAVLWGAADIERAEAISMISYWLVGNGPLTEEGSYSRMPSEAQLARADPVLVWHAFFSRGFVSKPVLVFMMRNAAEDIKCAQRVQELAGFLFEDMFKRMDWVIAARFLGIMTTPSLQDAGSRILICFVNRCLAKDTQLTEWQRLVVSIVSLFLRTCCVAVKVVAWSLSTQERISVRLKAVKQGCVAAVRLGASLGDILELLLPKVDSTELILVSQGMSDIVHSINEFIVHTLLPMYDNVSINWMGQVMRRDIPDQWKLFIETTNSRKEMKQEVEASQHELREEDVVISDECPYV